MIALTYGQGTEWAQNVLAAGGCRMRTPHGELSLGNPRLAAADTGVSLMPATLRPAMRLLGVRDFLLLDR